MSEDREVWLIVDGSLADHPFIAGILHDKEQHAVQEGLFPGSESPSEPATCVLGPHLPGWPLVTYKGSYADHHGPAKVQEAYSFRRSDGTYEFRLTLETDNPPWEEPHMRVLSQVRLASVVPLQPERTPKEI